VVFIGYNPGLESARLGHYYAHPGNAFWRHLTASGLLPAALGEAGCNDDHALMDAAGIGFTDLCPRPTLRAGELTTEEHRAGAARLLAELDTAAPRVAAFGGKQLFALFARHALAGGRAALARRDWGRQPEALAGGATQAWVLPSSSGLASRWHARRLELLREIARLVADPPPDGPLSAA
jgi:TDG/mug DNA glycosylase family protein